jgi:phospholipase C
VSAGPVSFWWRGGSVSSTGALDVELETPLSRRDFVLAGAAALGVPRFARAVGELGSSTALPSPARSGIDHIVVVMMENRSFDHMLGWLPGTDGKQAGLSYLDSSGVSHATYPLAPDYQGCGHPDPDHSYEGGRVQYNGGACDGFLRAGRSDAYAIGYYTRPDLAFLGAAAPYWTVCDRYFSAFMGPTYPNRLYLHAGVTDRISNTHTPSSLPTIWDRLAARGLRGRNYYLSTSTVQLLWGPKYSSIARPYAQFLVDCRRGRLPHVAFVDPLFGGASKGISGDDHPHGDIRAGEYFLAGTYKAITTSPAWPRTVLIVTFDEWGGFFDHVPPPVAPEVNPAYALRGFRVPCLVISPFARRRNVAHGIYDHASILRMIEWRWKLRPLSVRDAHANNLAAVLDFRRRNLRAPRLTAPLVLSQAC